MDIQCSLNYLRDASLHVPKVYGAASIKRIFENTVLWKFTEVFKLRFHCGDLRMLAGECYALDTSKDFERLHIPTQDVLNASANCTTEQLSPSSFETSNQHSSFFQVSTQSESPHVKLKIDVKDQLKNEEKKVKKSWSLQNFKNPLLYTENTKSKKLKKKFSLNLKNSILEQQQKLFEISNPIGVRSTLIRPKNNINTDSSDFPILLNLNFLDKEADFTENRQNSNPEITSDFDSFSRKTRNSNRNGFIDLQCRDDFSNYSSHTSNNSQYIPNENLQSDFNNCLSDESFQNSSVINRCSYEDGQAEVFSSVFLTGDDRVFLDHSKNSFNNSTSRYLTGSADEFEKPQNSNHIQFFNQNTDKNYDVDIVTDEANALNLTDRVFTLEKSVTLKSVQPNQIMSPITSLASNATSPLLETSSINTDSSYSDVIDVTVTKGLKSLRTVKSAVWSSRSDMHHPTPAITPEPASPNHFYPLLNICDGNVKTNDVRKNVTCADDKKNFSGDILHNKPSIVSPISQSKIQLDDSLDEVSTVTNSERNDFDHYNALEVLNTLIEDSENILRNEQDGSIDNFSDEKSSLSSSFLSKNDRYLKKDMVEVNVRKGECDRDYDLELKRHTNTTSDNEKKNMWKLLKAKLPFGAKVQNTQKLPKRSSFSLPNNFEDTNDVQEKVNKNLKFLEDSSPSLLDKETSHVKINYTSESDLIDDYEYPVSYSFNRSNTVGINRVLTGRSSIIHNWEFPVEEKIKNQNVAVDRTAEPFGSVNFIKSEAGVASTSSAKDETASANPSSPIFVAVDDNSHYDVVGNGRRSRNDSENLFSELQPPALNSQLHHSLYERSDFQIKENSNSNFLSHLPFPLPATRSKKTLKNYGSSTPPLFNNEMAQISHNPNENNFNIQYQPQQAYVQHIINNQHRSRTDFIHPHQQNFNNGPQYDITPVEPLYQINNQIQQLGKQIPSRQSVVDGQRRQRHQITQNENIRINKSFHTPIPLFPNRPSASPFFGNRNNDQPFNLQQQPFRENQKINNIDGLPKKIDWKSFNEKRHQTSSPDNSSQYSAVSLPGGCDRIASPNQSTTTVTPSVGSGEHYHLYQNNNENKIVYNGDSYYQKEEEENIEQIDKSLVMEKIRVSENCMKCGQSLCAGKYNYKKCTTCTRCFKSKQENCGFQRKLGKSSCRTTQSELNKILAYRFALGEKN
ncbi:hypothetical protein HK099_001574 [Clydaea vesicula]|uniref:Uncharacterized protein n=1 Tax=Clydaea vesicula TaxID=447962 RepID=A0AAD5U7S4_9FUNG|nr:hypothetical protein HK099_001574 [Clydaea vesicula]